LKVQQTTKKRTKRKITKTTKKDTIQQLKEFEVQQTTKKRTRRNSTTVYLRVVVTIVLFWNINP